MTDSLLVASPKKESTFFPSHAIDTARSLPSGFLGTLIAFLPKCPFCLAANLSMFGSAGLALTPYVRWFFPLLVAFLALHLLVFFQKVHEKGNEPLILSLARAATILSGRVFFSIKSS